MRNVSGQWQIRQGNGFFVNVNIAQNGTGLSGSAQCFTGEGDDFHEVVSMETDGSVSDTHFLFNISWNNGTRGRYSARFEPDGTLTGVTVDVMHPESQATWQSDRAFPLL